MPSCYKIFEYWANKYVLPDGKIGTTFSGDGIRVVENEHISQCFACGRPAKHEDILSWDKYDLELKDLWADKRVNSKLQKCHILAKQFGGSDEPDNLFLMCSDCHAESPDTRNREAFFRWVYRKRRDFVNGVDHKKMVSDITAEVEARGYSLEIFAKRFCELPFSERWNIIKSGLEQCGLHASEIAPSSCVVCVVDELEQHLFINSKTAV